MDTSTNPCELLDVWKAREECSLIALYEVKGSSGNHVSLLFGATSNGQILLFGHNGNIRYRTQIHTSSIINLAVDRHQGFIVTGSLDKTIRISSISQSRREIVSCIACINLKNYLPVLVSFVGLNYAVCSEDGVVHMFELVESKNTIVTDGASRKRLMYSCKDIPDHLRSDDHVEAITCISPIPMFDLFVTCSRDGMIKVWDMHNSLVREIAFGSPIDSMAITTGYGDLVFGIDHRVDKIKAKFCIFIISLTF
jgi:WD40 repeat protein